jgi:restriction system protein
MEGTMEDLREHLFLHEADIMPRLLRVGMPGGARLPSVLAGIKADLASTPDGTDLDDEDLLALIGRAFRRLVAAGLLKADRDGGFQTTERGIVALREHPMGVDESVLASFPEYQAILSASARRLPIQANGVTVADGSDDPHLPEYNAGHAAFLAREELTDNPHDGDTASHLAWENGWAQARDEAVARRRGG